MSDFSQEYQKYRNVFEKALEVRCEAMRFFPSVLTDGMKYSLLCGGKRVRPVLFFAALEAFGGDFRAETEPALALEFIHTYSLIHDDLPAMDNDDFRRGKPSNHKVFGEANAILAGDALLSLAFDLMLSECKRGEEHLLAARILSKAAGAEGLVGGQSADLLYTGRTAGEEELFSIYERKTGALVSACVQMAAAITGGDEQNAAAFGNALGILFQLTDDLLDVFGDSKEMGKTAGKDAEEGKLTCVKLFGAEQAVSLADEYAEKCHTLLSAFPEREFLSAFVDYVRGRRK